MTNKDGIDSILDLPTLGEDTELLDDQMTTFLKSNTVAYAGHRIIANFVQVSDYDETTEHNEVPFLDWWFFSIILSIYWIFRRILNFLGFSTTPLDFSGHMLVMNSNRHDKRYSLISVAEQLTDKNHDVLLLCSPEAQSYRKEWEKQGYSTTSFNELLGGIPLRRWLSLFPTTKRLIQGLKTRAPSTFDTAPKTLIFNFVFLEAVKAESCVQMSNEPTIHTYAPMGYLLAATDFDRIFSYQHGIMYETGDPEYRRGYPFFAPINYFTWGEAWHDKFRKTTPTETQLYPTGTPWHEFLTQLDADGDEEYDVLFLSSAGRQTAEGEEAFEEFVERLINVCERRDWRLRIKLHPKENGDWYANRNWSEHVLASDTALQNALLNTKVGVTTGSSTLIDSVILGTPYCVWYDQQSPLEQQNPDLVFDITPGTIEPTVEDAMEMAADDSGPPSVLNCDGVTDRIVEIATASDS